MVYIALSRRAAHNIEEIKKYSLERWGLDTAERYLGSLEDALNRLRADANLLRTKPEISRHLHFFHVREHFLICAQIENNIYVLAVKHGSMDLPARLAELEPTLLREAEMLHKTFLAKRLVE